MTEENRGPVNTMSAKFQGSIYMIEMLLGRLIATHPDPQSILAGAQPLIEMLTKRYVEDIEHGNNRAAEMMMAAIDAAEATRANVLDAIKKMGSLAEASDHDASPSGS